MGFFKKNLKIDITNGLLGYWKCNEGKGSIVNDYSGRNKIGTFINSPTWVFDSVFKKWVVSFTGASTQYISIGDIGLSSLSQATLSFWFRKKAAGSICVVGSSTDGQDEYNFAAYSDGTFYSQLGDQTTGGQYATFGTNDTNWHHYVGVFNGGGNGTTTSLIVYFDGVQLTSGTSPTLAFPVNNIPTTLNTHTLSFNIGLNQATGGSFYYTNGYHFGVRVYNRLLSAVEASILYKNKI